MVGNNMAAPPHKLRANDRAVTILRHEVPWLATLLLVFSKAVASGHCAHSRIRYRDERRFAFDRTPGIR